MNRMEEQLGLEHTRRVRIEGTAPWGKFEIKSSQLAGNVSKISILLTQ